LIEERAARATQRCSQLETQMLNEREQQQEAAAALSDASTRIATLQAALDEAKRNAVAMATAEPSTAERIDDVAATPLSSAVNEELVAKQRETEAELAAARAEIDSLTRRLAGSRDANKTLHAELLAARTEATKSAASDNNDTSASTTSTTTTTATPATTTAQPASSELLDVVRRLTADLAASKRDNAAAEQQLLDAQHALTTLRAELADQRALESRATTAAAATTTATAATGVSTTATAIARSLTAVWSVVALWWRRARRAAFGAPVNDPHDDLERR
jgi:chromosome segregation ATPase